MIMENWDATIIATIMPSIIKVAVKACYLIAFVIGLDFSQDAIILNLKLLISLRNCHLALQLTAIILIKLIDQALFHRELLSLDVQFKLNLMYEYRLEKKEHQDYVISVDLTRHQGFRERMDSFDLPLLK